MPKCYSEQEREYIRTRLKEEAAKCLSSYGIRKTTVDEIVKRVNIPKGTFYLFYPSKELLLFEVLLEQHEQVEKQMMETIASINPEEYNAETLTNIIVKFFKMTEEMPILKLMNSKEIELLVRKLPYGVLEEHFGHDNSMVEKIFSAFPTKKGIDTDAISAAFHAIYFATLHKEEIGKEHYDEALYMLVKGVVDQFV